MKRLFSSFICIFLCILLLMGCSFVQEESSSVIVHPSNMNLKIKGGWNAEVYKILEANVLSDEDIKNITSNPIKIRSNGISLSGEDIKKIRYTVKVVKPNYTISYENKYKMSNLLGNEMESIYVYSIIYQNKVLAEFFYNTEEESYLYYQGIIFKVKLDKDIDISEEQNYADYEGSAVKDESGISEGLYITLKKPSTTEGMPEIYRTLWISTKDGSLQDVKERENIIFPRLKGIWYLEPKLYENKERKIKYEYFESAPIDTATVEYNNKLVEEIKGNIEDGTTLLRNINFIGNDYIATEVVSNNSKYESGYYEVLPIDNMNTSTGISISDLYTTKDSYSDYTEAYNETYSTLNNEIKSSLSQYIDYSNFTLVRDNGKWVIQGRMSSLKNDKYINFPTTLKPIKKLLNYDTLLISWKLLKGVNPYMIDAYTSPYKSLAVIILKDEMLIYRIVDGTLSDEPLKRIQLEEGETVIMAEWCSSNYIDKWASAFKENSRTIK